MSQTSKVTPSGNFSRAFSTIAAEMSQAVIVQPRRSIGAIARPVPQPTSSSAPRRSPSASSGGSSAPNHIS